jgi:ABC-type uncharacterized transport system substrate-binding protein
VKAEGGQFSVSSGGQFLSSADSLDGLRQELDKLGWIEGRNIRIDYRYAPPGTRAEELAKELVALQPDVILAHTVSIATALQRETRAIPIVFVSVGDPFGARLICSSWYLVGQLVSGDRSGSPA